MTDLNASPLALLLAPFLNWHARRAGHVWFWYFDETAHRTRLFCGDPNRVEFDWSSLLDVQGGTR